MCAWHQGCSSQQRSGAQKSAAFCWHRIHIGCHSRPFLCRMAVQGNIGASERHLHLRNRARVLCHVLQHTAQVFRVTSDRTGTRPRAKCSLYRQDRKVSCSPTLPNVGDLWGTRNPVSVRISFTAGAGKNTLGLSTPEPLGSTAQLPTSVRLPTECLGSLNTNQWVQC